MDNIKAKYITTIDGNKLYRDRHGNIYTSINKEIYFCSNKKAGTITPDDAEPYYPVNNVILED